jgi:tetratricopeptide (TPR) repeat protein
MSFHKTAAVAATLLFISSSPVVFADSSSATMQCYERIARVENEGTEIIDADTVALCAQAAKESREGRLFYGIVLSARGNSEAAVTEYSMILGGHDLARSKDGVLLTALRFRALGYQQLDLDDLAFDDAKTYLGHEPDDVDIVLVAATTAPTTEMGLRYSERAVALDRENMKAHQVHARLLARAGKKKEALAAANSAAKLAPDNATALTIKGLVHADLNEHARAERIFAQAAADNPNEPQLKINRAHALRNLGRHKDAIAVTSAVLQDNPDHFVALVMRAMSHLELGNADAALKDIDKAKLVHPDWDDSEQRVRAENILLTRQMFSPEGIARIEQDRQVALRAVRKHLRSQCKHFELPSFSQDMDVSALNNELWRYRDCLKDWGALPSILIRDSFTPAEAAANDRWYEALHLFENDAQELRCSKMPKGASCIQDALFARAEPLLEGADNTPRYVYRAEVARLNTDVDALNKAINRYNKQIAVTNFLHDLAEALNE